MNYRTQDSFFTRYRKTAAVFTGLAAASWALMVWSSWDELRARHLAVLSPMVVATLYAMSYLPLYLRLSVEERKRAVWAVRVRWPLLAISGATAALFLVRQPLLPWGQRRVAFLCFAAWFTAEVIALIVSRTLLKRGSPPAHGAVPHLLAATEVGAVLMVHWAGVLSAMPTFVLLASAFCLWIVAGARAGSRFTGLGPLTVLLLVHVSMQVVGGELMGWQWGLVYALLVVIGTTRLITSAARHHEEQVVATTEELSSFAAVSREQATELLSTATGILARSWNASPPKAPTEVERWYEENSRYYLYDLAQFHLAYKHIAFMRDVISMCRGRVLDHGGGIGDVSLELARRGHRVTYLDVDGQTKAFARWKADRERLDVEFASDLDALEGPYDTIVSLDVLEHLPDPEPVVERLVSLLAPGGRIIVTAYFGPTKAHPMHFDHELDLGRFLRDRGLRDVKTFAMHWLRSEFLRKRGVLVYEKRQ